MSVIELENGELLVLKAVSGLPDPEVDGKVITAIVSTENPDSDGDVIRQGKNKKGAGWLLDHFNKIPLLLWQHERYTPNLSGPMTRAKVTKDASLGRVLALDPIEMDEGDPFAMHIHGKLERRVLRESSVGFRGITSESRRDKNTDSYLGREFFEQKLIEVSFANRGSNLDTDTAMKSLLGFDTHAQEAQGGNDAEIQELKEELADLMRQVAILNDLTKSLGDDVSSCDERILVVNKQSELSSGRSKMLKELHGALRRFGTAT